MAKHENLRGPENEPDETPEQAETSKQLRKMAQGAEAPQNRPVSELSTEEIERILQDRKNKELTDKSEKFISERDARRDEFLQDLGGGITMGEAQTNKKMSIRGAEYVGIYKDGKYVGDIVSDGNLTGITDKEFQDKAYALVAKSMGKPTGEERKEDKPRVEINVDDETRKLMGKMWITLHGEKLNLQYGQMEIDLYDNGDNQSIDLQKIDENRLLLRVTEKSGKIIEYTIEKGMFLPDSRKVKFGE